MGSNESKKLELDSNLILQNSNITITAEDSSNALIKLSSDGVNTFSIKTGDRQIDWGTFKVKCIEKSGVDIKNVNEDYLRSLNRLDASDDSKYNTIYHFLHWDPEEEYNDALRYSDEYEDIQCIEDFLEYRYPDIYLEDIVMTVSNSFTIKYYENNKEIASGKITVTYKE